MIQAEILFIKSDNFYKQKDRNTNEVTGYELFFKLINDFINYFNYSIHSFGEYDKKIQFNFKGDYMINLKECGNGRYIELYYQKDFIGDFTEKYDYLNYLIGELNIK